ncbi:hypothetical protein [Bacteroides sp. 519]|uniref:hypothetical protein n=1 Tax=Bacteroides sp. 519 TaxID=2302937 RepID=UPI0013D8A9EB|nr:hypothetical protein [Bacteroides sp. 519]NDV60163.1 hypothetical protein [Bacteroides sp. 519]
MGIKLEKRFKFLTNNIMVGKVLKIFFLFLCFCFNSCVNNNNSIIGLIDLQKWEDITVNTIVDKLRLDTIVYYKEGSPPLSPEYGDSIYTFESLFRKDLSLRKEFLKQLKENPIFETAKYIYIQESCGSGGAAYIKTFAVFQKRGVRYEFIYNTDKQCFEINEYHPDYNYENFIGDTILHEMEHDLYSQFNIITLIDKDKKNFLTYKLKYAYFD